jgi:hypothetical protein
MSCEVQFLAQGAFNKVYTIRVGDEIKHVIRVSLPVHPCFKTMNEVATIEYLRDHTNIPAPKVHGSQPSNTTDLGFEWMIQDFVPGRKLQDAWLGMSWLKKELLVRKLIEYLAQLFEKRFDRLGSLYKTKNLQQLPSNKIPDTRLLGMEHSTYTQQFCLGKIVSMPFFWGQQLDRNVPRGPYKHSREWLSAQLQLNFMERNDPFDDGVEDSDDDDDDHGEKPEIIKRRYERLMALLPKIFPENGEEEFVLHHDDLNTNNILVNENDELSGIIDWECVHTVPLYIACQMPKFLDGEMDRHVCPNPDKYAQCTDDEGNPKPNEMYERHLDEYENTCLWTFFLEEMGRVCPEWVKCYQNSRLKQGFADAVADFGEQFNCTEIDLWLDVVEKKGICPRLQQIRQLRQRLMDDPSAWMDKYSNDEGSEFAWGAVREETMRCLLEGWSSIE